MTRVRINAAGREQRKSVAPRVIILKRIYTLVGAAELARFRCEGAFSASVAPGAHVRDASRWRVILFLSGSKYQMGLRVPF